MPLSRLSCVGVDLVRLARCVTRHQPDVGCWYARQSTFEPYQCYSGELKRVAVRTPQGAMGGEHGPLSAWHALSRSYAPLLASRCTISVPDAQNAPEASRVDTRRGACGHTSGCYDDPPQPLFLTSCPLTPTSRRNPLTTLPLSLASPPFRLHTHPRAKSK